MTIEHDLRTIAMEAIRRNREIAEWGGPITVTCRVPPVPLLALVQRCERLRRAIALLRDAQVGADRALVEDSAIAMLVAEEER